MGAEDRVGYDNCLFWMFLQVIIAIFRWIILPDGESVKFSKNKRDMRTHNRWYGKRRQRILDRARDD